MWSNLNYLYVEQFTISKFLSIYFIYMCTNIQYLHVEQIILFIWSPFYIFKVGTKLHCTNLHSLYVEQFAFFIRINFLNKEHFICLYEFEFSLFACAPVSTAYMLVNSSCICVEHFKIFMCLLGYSIYKWTSLNFYKWIRFHWLYLDQFTLFIRG